MSHAKQLHHRRYLNDYLEIINREGLPGNVKSDLCLQVQNTVIATVQHVIEEALAEELYAYLGLARYEHLPWGRPPESTRSGSYQRALGVTLSLPSIVGRAGVLSVLQPDRSDEERGAQSAQGLRNALKSVRKF